MQGANLNDILIFVGVVDAGSFAAGAKSAGLTRSTAGKAVSRIEKRLGTRLLNRTTRSLSLTEEGRMFYEHGLKIIEAVDAAEASVAGRSGAPRGVLRLSVPDAFGQIVILPLLSRYLAAWPEIQVEVNFSDRVADLVDEGFDLAIRIGVTSPDTSLVSRVVAKYGTLLCAAPSYLATHGEPQDLDGLARHDCLIFASQTQRQGWRFRDDDGSWIKAQGHSRLRLDSGAAIRNAAIAGLGIALLPEFLVTADLAAGQLRRVLPNIAMEVVNIVALYPSKRLLEPRVRQFIDLIVDSLGSV